jgi:hypothetical protein
MTSGSRLAVDEAAGPLVRVLVINGATLPFAVVCPANPLATAP